MKAYDSFFSTRSLGVIFLLLMGLAYSVWLLHKSKPNPTPVVTQEVFRPDAYAETVLAIQINEQGIKHSEIRAPEVIHFPYENSANITKPSMIIYSDKGEEPWYISSDSGKSVEGSQKITLEENVVLHQPAGPKNQAITINTTLLNVMPKENLVTTDKPIVFTQPGIVVTSIGMNAYMNDKRVELLSHAKGTYDPTKADKSIFSIDHLASSKPSTAQ